MLSRNKIKYLASLKIKKYRTLHGQFIIEGDKIVRDIIGDGQVTTRQLFATSDWLNRNHAILHHTAGEVGEADITDLARITALETPPAVIAVLDIPQTAMDREEVTHSLSVALDNVQDPGNLGTIVRTANWFGINNVFCSEGCADIYNPKVIQASMGAILNVKVHYVDLPDILEQYSKIQDFIISGTFMEGTAVFTIKPAERGIILFGNESRGISNDYMHFISQRITIPAAFENRSHVEALNVASSVAIGCAVIEQIKE